MFDLKWYFCFVPNHLGSGSSIGKLSGSPEPLWKPTGNCSFASAVTVLAKLSVNTRNRVEIDAAGFDYHKLIIKKVGLNPLS